MSDRAAQSATQLANIESATGMTLADFTDEVRSTGLRKHGEILAHLKEDHGLSHGNANLVTHLVRESLEGGPASEEELLAAQYSGAKAHLRPVLEQLTDAARAFGEDVEVVVQKTGVSLRRTKQFALVRAASSKRVELGLNLPATPGDERVTEAKGMCSHRVDLASPDDVDDAVLGWLREAFAAAG